MTTQHAFMNRLRSLFNIDADQVPELTREQWYAFRDDPVRYVLRADDTQAAAIWREVEKRQKPAPDASADLLAVLSALVWEFGGSIEQYHKLGPDWTMKDGTETFNVSVVLDREELIEQARAAISKAEGSALQASGGEK